MDNNSEFKRNLSVDHEIVYLFTAMMEEHIKQTGERDMEIHCGSLEITIKSKNLDG